ncbi:Fic family protein [Parasphaerochaeta coccoides]|uniref:Filamentation induced by cAMP protein Fic n=1 Tax=Parasphaerochaeta coccoides (strain ATCC BAA-1237 / DSM 17374 / SPN1) TaxID=760011 RepID=F4GKM2_PARC1|nr:Fic family protein [Parasphaerochaeta coccoides]AEC01431.1 filamentation induced by cAMP protein Fic [Parasphaerochaeta coccoides DSM 17374]
MDDTKEKIFEAVDARKAAFDTIRPFEGAHMKQLKEHYRVETTWSSTALEGNTLTLKDTVMILHEGITVGGHPFRETMEVYGHAKAFDFMYSLIGQKRITEGDIKRLHELVAFENKEITPGRYRDSNVMIVGAQSIPPRWQDLPKELSSYYNWLEAYRDRYHPIEYAALAHQKLVAIHPFRDGNGRTCRLVMNALFLQEGYMPLSITPDTKREYDQALDIAASWGNAVPFVEFIGRKQIENYDKLMERLHVPFQEQGGGIERERSR